MASIFDVAKYIVEKTNVITAMKLQKLCYYAQAWSLVWDGEPLFDESIEAWINGPVVNELYQWHKGRYNIMSVDKGNTINLTSSQKETLDKVIAYYGTYNSQQLSDLTHMEDPWRMARRGMADNERGNQEITHEKMAEYYGAL